MESTSVPSVKMPVAASDITPALINAIMHPWRPDVTIDHVEVVDSKQFGDGMVSTAGRAIIDVKYSADSPAGLPPRLIFKLARNDKFLLGPLYANEVHFYNLLRPELADVEAPVSFGGAYDPSTQQFGLLLEDLTLRGATFPNTTVKVNVKQVESILDNLARLHARYWMSPRFASDLSWVETHVKGDLASFMNDKVPGHIQFEIDNENFKQELVEKLRTSGKELERGTKLMQKHQQTLPYTLLHGDTHLGNTYLLPADKGGLLDWQLSVRGYHMHDVNYLITTALSIGTRRAHERELLAFYLDRLAAYGVANPPSFEDSWTEYRRTLVWGIYVGWLTTNVTNYGWEINILNHLRLTAAYEDLETAKLVAELG